MRSLAISAAVLTFFGVAAVGWWSDVSPCVIGLRAAAGAAVMFVVALAAGRVLVAIVAQAVRQNRADGQKSKDSP